MVEQADSRKQVSPSAEIEAMRRVSLALERLNEEAILRVLKWASERFAVKSGLQVYKAPKDSLASESLSEGGFEDLPSIFDAANPTSDAERALVAGYFVQEVQQKENFGSQEVNTMLKNLGHGVRNIARAFDKLQNSIPRLVHQVEKKGKAKQARKTFKVTVEGAKKVRSMIAQTRNASS